MVAGIPSRNLTYEWGRTSPDELMRISDSLSIRATGIFATSSLIIGVTAAVGSLKSEWPLTFFGLAILCYLAVTIAIVPILRPKWSPVPDDPSILREDYWPLSEDDARKYYWDHVEETYHRNLKMVNDKGSRLGWGVVAMTGEVLSLIAWLLLLSLL